MTPAIPETLHGLSDWLAARLGDGHRHIVGGLVRLVRDLGARLVGQSVTWPPEVDVALSVVDAWCREQADDEALSNASKLLNERLDRQGDDLDDDTSAMLCIALAIVQAATYEDQDDWPGDVVVPAAEMLMHWTGLDERQAAAWARDCFSG